jgi:hypothetical protein
MSQEEKAMQADGSAANSYHQVKRQPYIKPAFRFEPVFATTALSCGKTPTNPELTCQTNKKVS